ncbi:MULTISPECIES: ABC-type transport auxiliary lipoprotein family protein [Sphingomonadaceae]|nr:MULTISPECIES: ABC-type transport auxiliary lipoprotein family protein [Sphingobium]
MTLSTRNRTFALLSSALLLASCGNLLGGGERADLFRFGVVDPTPVTGMQGALPTRSVSLLRPRFSQEVEGDRMLTTRGERALYLKGVRWVAPVPDLFTQALMRQYAARAPDVRLTGVRNATGASHALQIDIERFEARYALDGGEKAPPTVIIEGDATLFDLSDRRPVEAKRFLVQEPASANTTSGIVAAFDRAVARSTTELTDWSADTARKHSTERALDTSKDRMDRKQEIN